VKVKTVTGPGIRYGVEVGNVLVRIGDTYISPGITKDELKGLRKALQKPAFLLFSLSFCVLVTISPRRAKLGGFPRGMRSAGTPPPAPAAGEPPAGPWQEPKWVYSYVNHV
jgi:hypothetical protein